MARYRASGDQTLTSSNVTCLTVGSNATTAQRNEIYEYVLSHTGTAGVKVIWTVQRCSALGTSTAQTPGSMEDAARAAQAAAGSNHTVEPTYTSNAEILKLFNLIDYASFRWVAPPGGEAKHAATVGAGFGWAAKHASATTDIQAEAFWIE